MPQNTRKIEQFPLIRGHHACSYALSASTRSRLMNYLDVPCDKPHTNGGPDKLDYKCIFIY
jgi:hypothetical protein